jgi:SAM domain (Sterile alpha motif)
MSEIRKWLEAIGLGQYGDAFEANKIDMDLLRQVDDHILKDIGVSAAGDRMRSVNWPLRQSGLAQCRYAAGWPERGD